MNIKTLFHGESFFYFSSSKHCNPHSGLVFFAAAACRLPRMGILLVHASRIEFHQMAYASDGLCLFVAFRSAAAQVVIHKQTRGKGQESFAVFFVCNIFIIYLGTVP